MWRASKVLVTLVGLAASVTLVAPGNAATISLDESEKGGFVLTIAGVITPADVDTVDALLQFSRSTHRPVQIHLIASPGGASIPGWRSPIRCIMRVFQYKSEAGASALAPSLHWQHGNLP